ncbi:MAG TPA: ribosomal protein S18-alanine N-acetyltransferase [Candidatus Avanaerovorax faecigallinarum]|nr:ribosomal protein S18-alanine N-acetyltransferase [Candidatus Avanaerovorax faecigallinarum]
MRTRFAEEKDLPAMAEIERRCFHTPWSEESLREDLTGNPLSVYMVLETENGDVAGYMSLWKILDEGHINNVAVLPEYRRRGGASDMLKFMLKYSQRSGISSHTLEVRVSNEGAIGLYGKFGFKEAGVRKGYYEDNGEDALIMWRNHEG